MVDPITVEAKVRLVGERVTEGVVAAVPVPETDTVCVPSPSTIFSVAVRVPVVVGWNDMVTVQEAPAAIVEPNGQVVEAA